MRIPRFLIAAGASGSGKTLITCGILQCLKNRGLKTASFKCGPDYIDPMFHSKVLGTKSRNLDTFFTQKDITRYLLADNAKGEDIAVMEGVMGYYDGIGGTTSGASAYELAGVTETPVVLIVNSKGMSVSILPYIKGFLEYKKDSRIQGVILNQMSPMLYPRIQKMIEENLPVKVLGYVPNVQDCVIESRHLGLVMPNEVEDFQEKLLRLSDILEKTLDVEALLELAACAGELEIKDPGNISKDYAFKIPRPVNVAIARDEAFCFIYEDNLKLLENMGARLLPFSPLKGESLPKEADGLLLYGGYPELYARSLAQNQGMKQSILRAITQGMPTMAECGGFMYLHEQMEDMEGNTYDMVGAISGKAYRTPRLSRFGYVELSTREGTVFGEKMKEIPAHEFHYFDSTACGEDLVARKPGTGQNRSWDCMYGRNRLLAGFPHLYYYGKPQVVKAFLTQCAEYQREVHG